MGSFSLDVSKFVAKANKNVDTVVRSVSIKLFSAIIKASPVDTGRFRMNWQTSGPIPAQGMTTQTDPSGNLAISNATKYITANSISEYTMANNLPYAERLEYGWSKQAPVGMIRVNVARFQTLIDQEAAKVR